MEFFFAGLKLIAGFFFLIVCADALVRSSVSLAYKLNINPSFVGLTLIAAGTSAPEIATSLMASYNDQADIAVGNLFGSNLFNILVILGLSSLFVLKKIPQDLIKIELPLLGLVTLLMIWLMGDFSISTQESSLFLFLLFGFTIFAAYRAKRSQAAKEDIDSEVDIINQWWKIIALLIAGLAGISFGADIALKGGTELGRLAGLSERIIGLTIISIGTGLPELAASTVAALRGQASLAFTNVLGSNIINSLGITGVVAISKPVNVDSNILQYDAKILTAITLLLFPLIVVNKYAIPKWQGALFLGGYVYYLYSLL